jgi:glutamate-1-semialdehyde 2,1-aminomutase
MTTKANELFEKSKELVPGGVHSPVRSFKGLDMAPRFVESAKGATFTDTEGKEYIDFCMSFGPLILGHRNPKVEEALVGAISKGWSYGACEPYSLELAKLLTSKIDFVEQIRFVNSGTEAVMTALRLARGFTKRNKIIKFNGCYHGHTDSMLIKAGSGLAGEATSSSAGVSEQVASETLILELGDEQGLKECFEREGGNIAAIIIEPLPANNGLLIQTNEFLSFLRSLTKEHGSLLIFDEVISGFRAGFGGMAKASGVTPDLVTYGKVIGGGLPVGALGGPRNIMEHLAPTGPVYQAGTLSANPLAMAGGLANLTQLTDDVYEALEKSTKTIVELFTKWLQEYNGGQFKDYQVHTAHSLFWIAKCDPIAKASDIPATIGDDFSPLFKTLLDKGIYLAPNGYEVGFVSTAHDSVLISELEKRLWS